MPATITIVIDGDMYNLPEPMLAMIREIASENDMTQWSEVWTDYTALSRDTMYDVGMERNKLENATVSCNALFEPKQGVIKFEMHLRSQGKRYQCQEWFLRAENINTARLNASELFTYIDQLWHDVREWGDLVTKVRQYIARKIELGG